MEAACVTVAVAPSVVAQSVRRQPKVDETQIIDKHLTKLVILCYLRGCCYSRLPFETSLILT